MLTANQSFILGYTNETDGIYKKGEVIVFDDFTCDMKYANFPFKVKSSAIKLLTTRDSMPVYFGYNLLRHINYKPMGHARHWISVLQSYMTSIPSLSEQQKISIFLKLVDQRIDFQAKYIDALKKYKRGLNHKLLSEIDEQYNHELGTVCSIVGGGTPDTLRSEYWEGNVEWFTPSEIGKSKYVSSSLRKISQIGLSNSSAKSLPAGTVLLTTRATLGEMSIARSECSTNQGFQSLVADSKSVLPEYLYYLQILIKPWCEKYASGNTFREISKASLSKCVVPIPGLNSQKKIVCILSRIDDMIEKHEYMEESLTQIKEGLLQQLFI